MNIKALFISFIFLINLSFCQNDNTMDQTIYQFKVKDIEGKTFDFENLRGKKGRESKKAKMVMRRRGRRVSQKEAIISNALLLFLPLQLTPRGR